MVPQTIWHVLAGVLFFLYAFSVSMPASAERIVRVGWYEYSTLSMYDAAADPSGGTSQEDIPGVYGGYNYEYLRMLSQIAGWKLQFVHGTINESLERLQRGEVDLVGGVGRIPEREAVFAFPDNIEIRSSVGLIARADDERFTPNDMEGFDGIRVGAVDKTNPLYKLQKWAEKRNVRMQIMRYDSFAAMYAAFDNGEVDAVTDSLLAPQPTRKVLVSMEPQGVYFVGNKNNPELMQELDDAISRLYYLKPGYVEALADKYLYTQWYSSFAPSRREKAWLEARIASGEPVKVSFPQSLAPIAYIDPMTGKPGGIMADVFNRIAEMTGLSFQYIPAEQNAMDGKKAEMLGAVSMDFAWADLHNMMLSQSVFDAPVFIVQSSEQENPDVIAIQEGTHRARMVEEAMKREGQNPVYLDCPSVEACLRAVKDGKAGRTYINTYEMNYFLNQTQFAYLKMQPVPGFTESISIGISKDADPVLCSIVCLALRSISPGDMNNIIIKNTTFDRHTGIVDFVYTHPIGALSLAALLALGLGGTGFFYYSNRKNKRLRQELEDILASRMSLMEDNKKLNYLSQYDTLTGLPNRRHLDAYMDRVYAEHNCMVLAMLDIDEFKKYNDNYGHLAGDQVLIAVAKLLEKYSVTTGSFTARFGGEEFLWVDVHHSPEEAASILEEFRAAVLRQDIVHESTSLGRLTLSIGYAEKRSGESTEELIERADAALYEAKAQGRNRIVMSRHDS